jgi:cytochrome c oxidase cbb3-type subunit 4
MDINDLRSGVTVVAFLLFLALMVWAWSRKRKADFTAASMLPFQDESPDSSQPPARGGAQ